MIAANTLVGAVEEAQRALEEGLVEALAPHRDRRRIRDGYAATDAFLAVTSRHLSAVEAVLLRPVVREVPSGQALVREYLAAAHALESTLCLVKARLYGEAHAMHLEWRQLWATVEADLAEHNALERRMADQLDRRLAQAQLEALTDRLTLAALHAPTRPHPRLPHRGVLGRLTRRVMAVADRARDTAEGRVIPDVVSPGRPADDGAHPDSR